jgi:hypothetical protein
MRARLRFQLYKIYFLYNLCYTPNRLGG